MSANSTSHSDGPGDFTLTRRIYRISLIAIAIGFAAAWVALALLRLIGLFTNLFFYQRWSTSMASPAGNHLGALEVVVPIVGALIVGVMARFGSDKIRGHGIPEAMEAILINGSRVEPKVALLKPISAAISIGSGGPFGAEGPIIMTGGALGSLVAQMFHLTSSERKTLLVAGAAAGMSATFAAPVASVLLAVEVLLFEWKPRSLIPVALASVTAAAARRYILGAGPLFAVPYHSADLTAGVLVGCAVAGILAGVLASVLTKSIYFFEDQFGHLPLHWMWWPALGGLAIGLGGLIFPQALGVGYNTIGTLLQGSVGARTLLGVLFVKSTIWAVSLGSGTSGGVLAPILMMGAALGGLEASFLPHHGAGFWPLVSMGAVLAGTMRAPLTSVIFSLELTHDVSILLPILLAGILAHTFSVLVLRRSILTEKVARRGYLLSCEYAVDPLEILMARDVMRANVLTVHGDVTAAELLESVKSSKALLESQHAYPIVSDDTRLLGIVSRERLMEAARSGDSNLPVGEIADALPLTACADEPLASVAYRMADTGVTRLPVVDCENDGNLVGMIALNDLLKARSRHLESERRRERIISLRPLLGRSRARG